MGDRDWKSTRGLSTNQMAAWDDLPSQCALRARNRRSPHRAVNRAWDAICVFGLSVRMALYGRYVPARPRVDGRD